MTSRLAHGGLHSLLSIKPDMITLGKYLGGGMPFGAFGGGEDIMKIYDPRTPAALAHSGTFQNNTLMLNAGFIGLSQVYTEEAVTLLNSRGQGLRDRLREIFKGTRFCVTGQGSLMCIHATVSGLLHDQITCKDDVATVEDLQLKRLFWLKMLEAGFWVQLRGSIALNLQIPEEAIDSFAEAVGRFCDSYRSLISITI
jgi:glutamate-1-semialdehyde 2,1-aminomutase